MSPGTLIIAEVAQSHDGSLGTAHAFIEAVAESGADAVKFQTHIAAAESTPAEPWRTRFSTQDQTRYDYWKRMEFSRSQWRDLKRHADDLGLLFLSSPFSLEAFGLLEELGVEAWKIPSGEVANRALLNAAAATGKPVYLSTGMSAFAEIDDAVGLLRAGGSPLTVLQCTSDYPCRAEDVGLNLIAELSERYGCPVGLSDHSGTIFPSLAAVTLGAVVVEVHVTLSRSAFGPDVPASITVAELAELVRGVRFIERMLASPVDKDSSAERLAPMRRLFTKSLVAARPLEAGAVLAASDLLAKKPGTGISPDRVGEVLGRRLSRPLALDELLTEEHLVATESPVNEGSNR